MSDTLIIRVRQGDQVLCNETDHSLMLRFEGGLKAVAGRLGVRKLPEFYDYSSMESEFRFELGEEGDEEEWTADKAKWFDAAEGLETVEALIKHLNQNSDLLDYANDSSRAHWRDNLLDELEDCRSVLADGSLKGLRFHLSMEM